MTKSISFKKANATVICSDATFEELVEALNTSRNGYVVVCDSSGLLEGVVTDGDLRRGVISNNFTLEGVINRNPVSCREDASYEEIKEAFSLTFRGFLVVVGQARQYKGIYEVASISNQCHEIDVVLMVGGLGKRLGELTKTTPKPLMPIAGRPVLERIVSNLVEQNFVRITLAVNYLAEQIEEFFSDGSKFGAEISYIKEKKKLGTAGALHHYESNGKPLIVMNGDLLLDLDFAELMHFHMQSGAELTVVSKEISQKIEYGVIETGEDDKILAIREKPEHFFKISAGVYVLSHELLGLVPKDEFFDMPQLVDLALKKNRRVCYFNLFGFWFDIGRKKDLEFAQQYYSDKKTS